jgi:hypothetical protein
MNYESILRESSGDRKDAIAVIFKSNFGEWAQTGYLHNDVIKRIYEALGEAYDAGIDDMSDEYL